MLELLVVGHASTTKVINESNMIRQFGQMEVFIAWIFYFELKIKTNIDFPLFPST